MPSHLWLYRMSNGRTKGCLEAPCCHPIFARVQGQMSSDRLPSHSDKRSTSPVLKVGQQQCHTPLLRSPRLLGTVPAWSRTSPW